MIAFMRSCLADVEEVEVVEEEEVMEGAIGLGGGGGGGRGGALETAMILAFFGDCRTAGLSVVPAGLLSELQELQD